MGRIRQKLGNLRIGTHERKSVTYHLLRPLHSALTRRRLNCRAVNQVSHKLRDLKKSAYTIIQHPLTPVHANSFTETYSRLHRPPLPSRQIFFCDTTRPYTPVQVLMLKTFTATRLTLETRCDLFNLKTGNIFFMKKYIPRKKLHSRVPFYSQTYNPTSKSSTATFLPYLLSNR